jgi:hypothetical protein
MVAAAIAPAAGALDVPHAAPIALFFPAVVERRPLPLLRHLKVV